MDGPFTPSHAGADDLIGHVLIEGSAFLPELGMAWCGQVAHGVEPAGGVSLEGEGFCDGADGLAIDVDDSSDLGSPDLLILGGMVRLAAGL